MGMYWYVTVPACTILPDPVQGYRIPDAEMLMNILVGLGFADAT